ncbi:MAG TPA: twin-arginine translocase subunit TatC [Tepidiformaceae bacterium]
MAIAADASPKDSATRNGEMTLLEHLLELRNRTIVVAIAVIIGCLVCFLFWQDILGWLLAPGRAKVPGFKVSSFSPVDRIGVIFQIGMYGGFALASPVIIYEALAYIVPGLTKRERKLLFPAVFGSLFFLVAGMAFAYWLVLPLSLGFLLNVGKNEIANVTGVKEYIAFVTRTIFWSGLAFELPMIMALIAWLGLAKPRQLLGFWRYAVVLIFVLACFVVPTPDPVDQTIVAVPLFSLYLLGILFAKLAYKPRFSSPD